MDHNPFVSRLIKAVASSPVGDELTVGLGDTFGIGALRGKQLPIPFSPGNDAAVWYGNQPMVNIRSFVFGKADKDSEARLWTMFGGEGSYDNLLSIVKDGSLRAAGYLDNPEKALRVIGRGTKRWASLHLRDLNAFGGAYNFGAVGALSRTRQIFFQDYGRRVESYNNPSQEFMRAVLDSEAGNPSVAFKEIRQKYISEMAAALRMAGPNGEKLHFSGIKDAGYELIKRFNGKSWVKDTRLVVNTGDPNASLPFAAYRDFIGGNFHYSNYVRIPAIGAKGKHFTAAMLHPLVAGSSYGEDLEQAAKLFGLKPKSFGTAIRADVGFLHGPGAGFFFSSIGGDSGSVATSTRMLHAIGAAASENTYTIKGIKGLPGLPNATTELSAEIMGLPGFSDFLRDESRTVFSLEHTLKSRELARRTTGRAFLTGNAGDLLYRVEKLGKGLRFRIRGIKPRAPSGMPLTIAGARTTLGIGSAMKGLDILTHDLRWSDPRILRERYLSHYASRVASMAGFDKLEDFAKMGGFKIHGIHGNLKYISTEGNAWLDPGHMFSFAGDDFMSQSFAEKLAQRYGGTFKDYLPREFKLTKKTAISQLVTAGGMSPAQALKYYEDNRGLIKGLRIRRMEGISTRVRTSGVIKTEARVRASEARRLLTKLKDFTGDGSESVAKLSEFLSRSIGKVDRRVGGMVGGMFAPIMGEGAVQQLVSSHPESFGMMNLSELRSEEVQALHKQIKNELSSYGGIKTETFDILSEKLGLSSERLGTFINLKDSKLAGLNIFSGARSGADQTFGVSDYLFLPNIRKIAPQLNQGSSTGLVGDAIFPRNPLRAGMEAAEYRSLDPFASVWNLYDSLLGSEGRGALEKRLAVSNISVRELMLGSKGTISKKAISGTVGGRYIALTSAEEGMTVSLSRRAILKNFGSRPDSLGRRMIRDITSGKDVYAFFKRDPVQSGQQLIPVKVRLRGRPAEAIAGRVNTEETIHVGRHLAARAQLDHDGDYANLYLLSERKNKTGNKILTYEEIQDAIRAMWNREKIESAPFSSMIDTQLRSTITDLSSVKGPYEKIDALLSSIGFKASDIDEALREAGGAFSRKVSSGYIGLAYTFATRQQSYIDALSGAGSGFRLPSQKIAEISSRMGLSIKSAEGAEHLRIIYGFLKKGGSSSEETLAAIANLSLAPRMVPGTDQWNRSVTSLAESLLKIAPSMSGSGSAHYAFGSERALKFAQSAAAAGLPGIEDPKYYESVADMLMRVSRAGDEISKSGRKAIASMTGSRSPKNILGSLVESLFGMNVSLPSRNMSASVGLMEHLMPYISGSSNVSSTVQAAAAAIPGKSEIGKDALSALRGTRSWTALKVAGAAAAGVALYDLFTGPPEQATGPILNNPQTEMPPAPIIGFPNDGARPSGFSPRVADARVDRVMGQRRHFGGEDSIFMPSGFDSTDGYNNYPDQELGSIPTTMSEAMRMQKDNLNRDF